MPTTRPDAPVTTTCWKRGHHQPGSRAQQTRNDGNVAPSDDREAFLHRRCARRSPATRRRPRRSVREERAAHGVRTLVGHGERCGLVEQHVDACSPPAGRRTASRAMRRRRVVESRVDEDDGRRRSARARRRRTASTSRAAVDERDEWRQLHAADRAEMATSRRRFGDRATAPAPSDSTRDVTAAAQQLKARIRAATRPTARRVPDAGPRADAESADTPSRYRDRCAAMASCARSATPSTSDLTSPCRLAAARGGSASASCSARRAPRARRCRAAARPVAARASAAACGSFLR